MGAVDTVYAETPPAYGCGPQPREVKKDWLATNTPKLQAKLLGSLVGRFRKHLDQAIKPVLEGSESDKCHGSSWHSKLLYSTLRRIPGLTALSGELMPRQVFSFNFSAAMVTSVIHPPRAHEDLPPLACSFAL
ncbi:hypothetical protein FRC18_000005 [Serendipita sp. 400]|nr:hypothetical protein FRC18_000005 [Serendipita sp. 400]